MSWTKNSLTVLIATILGLIFAEVVLRLTTDLPDRGTYRKIDTRFGNLLVDRHPDADVDGFRNPNQKNLKAEIAAIGDSHTYGYNVIADESWPAKLSSTIGRPVRNLGIGGNGVYSYHWLVNEALTSSKKIVLGLYMPNDFQAHGYFCDIDFNMGWWRMEKERIALSIPNKGCVKRNNAQSDLGITHREKFERIVKSVVFRSAFFSAFFDEVYKPLFGKENVVRSLNLNNQLAPISLTRLEKQRSNTDLADPIIKDVYEDFLRMARDWQARGESDQFVIMLIPSRQLVYYTYLKEVIGNTEQASILFPYVEFEIRLEKKLLNDLERLKIPVESAKNDVVTAFRKSLDAEGADNFYPDRGHPNQLGYEAYARTAKRLYYITWEE